MAFGWHWLIVAGVIVLSVSALVEAPGDSSYTTTVAHEGESTNVTLPQLLLGAGFMTISWSGDLPGTSVSLFYCSLSSCPYSNWSELSTGRTNWTEFYGDTGSSGSISDYWNNANPLPYTKFLVSANGFPGVLSLTVSVIYHNPSAANGWLQPSGATTWEFVLGMVGGALVGLGTFRKLQR